MPIRSITVTYWTVNCQSNPKKPPIWYNQCLPAVTRCILALLITVLLVPAVEPAQKKKKTSDEDGMLPIVVDDSKKKKKKEEETQVLPPPKELPSAVIGEMDRLSFQVSPLSGRGLLTQQTREALRALQQKNHNSTIIKLRAFVAGSGDMRRIGELVGELWEEKHLPLPALSVVQTGGIPLEAAQVVIESVATEKRSVNPYGVAFFSGRPGENLSQSLASLADDVKQAGMDNGDVLRVTCYVRSLDENRDGNQLMAARFPAAAANYVQMQREYALPVAECDAVARRRTATSEGTPKLVFTGTQLAFGSQDNDIRLAFERLQKTLVPFNTDLHKTIASHVYLISPGLTAKIRTVGSEFYGKTAPGAMTVLAFEGLPSLDASFGLDVIVLSGATATGP
ncbi:MAG TPA: hypothetical protein VKU01_25355 [Bryobacteraceae bacterium]|nr:hypothetical protein [Bryobacteraceae bacterium]